MRNLFFYLVLLLLFASCSSSQKEDTNYTAALYLYEQMQMHSMHSLQYKWNNKEIYESLLLDGAESLDNWELVYTNGENVGTVSLSTEKVYEGESSIKFKSPTKQPVDLGPGGRYWGRQNLTRKFDGEDFSKYNRISVNIYPEFEGFRKLYLTIILHNADNVPDVYGKEGWHTVMLENNQWNKLVMEMPHLPRNEVTGITISYGLQGNEIDASDTIVYYVDNLTLEVVDADYYEGWGTDKEISFTHSGYNTEDEKIAFTSILGEKRFRVVNTATNKSVLEKEVQRSSGNIGDFTVFDFSELKIPGNYKIVYSDTESKSFSVGDNVWVPIIEKITNQFYLQRCGFDQPGIHLECHTDWYTVFKGDTIVMAGGWHDAGDLSQSYWQTASATATFFRLARLYQKENKTLSDRLVEEGIWGLSWLHKNRFEGLEVIGWTTMDSYTDGIIGNFDDKYMDLRSNINVVENYYSIIADVEAFLMLENRNNEAAEKSLGLAVEYWDLLSKEKIEWNTERLSVALLAGTKLYNANPADGLKNILVEYADSLISYQQQEPMNWTIPLNGFFYWDKSKDNFFGYDHSCTVASPILGLVELCTLFPDHNNYDKWYESVRLYTEYIKTTAKLTDPYYMIPANIYKLKGTEDDKQIMNGLKLDDEHYLRMFPVWHAFRGNSSIMLSPATGIASANFLLNDPELHKIALAQLEWMVGKNPFNQSLMYGEGYNFSPQYAVFTGDIVGGLPVGILTRDDLDIPYWKAAVLHNYKELWGQPAFRMMELMALLHQYNK